MDLSPDMSSPFIVFFLQFVSCYFVSTTGLSWCISPKVSTLQPLRAMVYPLHLKDESPPPAYRSAESPADQTSPRPPSFLSSQPFHLSQRQLQRLAFVSSPFLQSPESCQNPPTLRQAFNLSFDCFASSDRRSVFSSYRLQLLDR